MTLLPESVTQKPWFTLPNILGSLTLVTVVIGGLWSVFGGGATWNNINRDLRDLDLRFQSYQTQHEAESKARRGTIEAQQARVEARVENHDAVIREVVRDSDRVINRITTLEAKRTEDRAALDKLQETLIAALARTDEKLGNLGERSSVMEEILTRIEAALAKAER